MSDLTDLSLEAVQTLGGKAPVWAIAEHVAAQLDDADYRDATRSGFVAIIRGALRAQDSNGLPKAVSVRGEYVQTDMLTLDEFSVVIAGYLNRSKANLGVAEKLDALCVVKHGVSVLGDEADTGT